MSTTTGRALVVVRRYRVQLLLVILAVAVFCIKYHFIVCGCIRIERSLQQGNGVVLSGYPNEDLFTIASDFNRHRDFNQTCLSLTRKDQTPAPPTYEEWKRTNTRSSNVLPHTVCRRLFEQNKSSDFTVKSDEKLYYQHVFQKCPKANQRVPNIVHFMWFYGRSVELRFHHLLSALSALRVIKPCHIIVWTDGYTPAGKWWDYLTAEVSKTPTTLVVRTITPPACISGKHLKYGEHKADWTKLMVMHEIGGVSIILVTHYYISQCKNFNISLTPRWYCTHILCTFFCVSCGYNNLLFIYFITSGNLIHK